MRVRLNGDGNGGEWEGDLSEFLRHNSEALDMVDEAEIRATLQRGEVYRGGGGAAAGWRLERVVDAKNKALLVKAINDQLAIEPGPDRFRLANAAMEAVERFGDHSE